MQFNCNTDSCTSHSLLYLLGAQQSRRQLISHLEHLSLSLGKEKKRSPLRELALQLGALQPTILAHHRANVD